MIDFDKVAENLKLFVDGTPALFWLIKPNDLFEEYLYIFRFKNIDNNFKWAVEICEDEASELEMSETDMTSYLTEYIKKNLPDLLFVTPRSTRKRKRDTDV